MARGLAAGAEEAAPASAAPRETPPPRRDPGPPPPSCRSPWLCRRRTCRLGLAQELAGVVVQGRHRGLGHDDAVEPGLAASVLGRFSLGVERAEVRSRHPRRGRGVRGGVRAGSGRRGGDVSNGGTVRRAADERSARGRARAGARARGRRRSDSRGSREGRSNAARTPTGGRKPGGRHAAYAGRAAATEGAFDAALEGDRGVRSGAEPPSPSTSSGAARFILARRRRGVPRLYLRKVPPTRGQLARCHREFVSARFPFGKSARGAATRSEAPRDLVAAASAASTCLSLITLRTLPRL